MKVLLLIADQGGCAFYRMKEPARVARMLGVDVQIDDHIDVHAETDPVTKVVTVNEVKTDADLIVIQRPLNNAFTSMIQQANKQGIATAVELDDDFEMLHRSNMAYNATFNTPGYGPQWLKSAAQEADLFITSTPALTRYVTHDRTEVLRNNVPASIFENKPAYERERDSDAPVIGWTGTVQTHPFDLQMTKGSLAQLDHDYHLHIVGDGGGVLNALNLPTTQSHHFTDWLPMEEYYDAIAKMDIGIVPLELSPFNQAKCIDAATKIVTKRGVVPASSLSVFDHVWNEGAWRQVEAVSKEQPRKGLRFTVEDGYSIDITPEHRMLVGDRWVEAKDIVVGDVMHLQPETVPDRPYVRLPWPSDSRMSKREGFDGQEFTDRSDVPHVEITPRWGRFLGAYCGDGSISGKTAVSISCDGIDQDWVDLLANDLDQMGFNPGDVSKKMFDGTVLRRRAVRVASAHLVRVLQSWGLAEPREDGYPKRVVRVPDFIWHSPKDVIAEFIAGYFEADGCLTQTGADTCSKDRQILADIQRLLLLFGIESRLHSRIHSNQTGYSALFWHLSLRRAALDMFHAEIGFKSKRKVDRASSIVSKPHSNAYRPLSWRKKVVSVEEVTVTPVDIQVDGSVFAAAGFVSHNSALKGLEMAAMGVPFVASPTQEYERLALYGVGTTASGPSAWRKQLNRLLERPAERLKLAKRYRETVYNEMVYERNAHGWIRAWEKAIAHRKSSLS